MQKRQTFYFIILEEIPSTNHAAKPENGPYCVSKALSARLIKIAREKMGDRPSTWNLGLWILVSGQISATLEEKGEGFLPERCAERTGKKCLSQQFTLIGGKAVAISFRYTLSIMNWLINYLID